MLKQVLILFLFIGFFPLFAQNNEDAFDKYMQKYHQHLQQKVVRNSIYALAKSDPAEYKRIVSTDMHNAQISAKKIMAAKCSIS
jgi:hypothetical protein